MEAEEELLDEVAFAGRDNLIYLVIPVLLIIISFYLVGIIGNVMICIVIAKNQQMRTAHNFYLFSLAVMDLLICFRYAMVFYRDWSPVLGVSHCTLDLASEVTFRYGSDFIVIALTVERYIAICHPSFSHTTSSLSLTVKTICTAWLLAVLLAIPQVMKTEPVFIPLYENDTGIEFCQQLPSEILDFKMLEASVFIEAMTIGIVLSVIMGIKLKRSQSSFYNARAQTQSFYLLVAILVTFFLHWGSYHLHNLWNKITKYSDQEQLMFFYKHFFTLLFFGLIEVLARFVNPILYYLISSEFREGFKDILCCKKTRQIYRTESVLPLTLGDINSSIRESSESHSENHAQSHTPD